MTQEQIAQRKEQAGSQPRLARGSSASRARSRRCGARPRVATAQRDQARPGDIPGWGRAWTNQDSFREGAFDPTTLAHIQNNRFTLVLCRTLRPALFVSVAVDPDEATPHVAGVSGNFVEGQFVHFVSPFRRAEMAGMGGSYRHVVPMSTLRRDYFSGLRRDARLRPNKQ